ncbi:MAG: AEC family transporter [Gammaproteobacteria bacterium]|nr:AEC family transporter [Gammaproteobacteria bacterium]
MSLVLAVIAPVFGAVGLGFVLLRAGIFDSGTSDGLAKFVYYVAIPALLFRSLARADLPDTLPWDLLIAFYVPSFAMFLGGALVARYRLGWDRASMGVAGMGACYSNMVMLGLPLATTAFGPSAAVPLFSILAIQSSLLFPPATYCIEVYGAHGDTKRPWYHSKGRLLLNPVIFSLALGIAANLSGNVPVGVLDSLLERLAQAAPGCALVSLGISLGQYRVSGGLREVSGFLILKNFLHPLLVWGLCLALTLPLEWTRVAVLLAAMPSGVNAYVFAKRYGLREEAMSKTIVLSTALTTLVTAVVLHFFLHQ